MEQTTASTGLETVLIVHAYMYVVKSVSEENNRTWFHLSHRPKISQRGFQVSIADFGHS